MSRTQNQMFVQLLPSSPFARLFERGCVPVKETPRTLPIPFILETDQGEEKDQGYMLDWEALPCDLQSRLSDLLAHMYGGTWQEVVKYMAKGGDIPIRLSQISTLFVRVVPLPEEWDGSKPEPPIYGKAQVDWRDVAEQMLKAKMARESVNSFNRPNPRR